MAKTMIEIPDERFQELEAYKDRLGELLLLGLSQIKIQEALLLYQRGLVSFGRAAELAGLSEQELMRQARAFGVSPRWAEKMIGEEIWIAESLCRQVLAKLEAERTGGQ